MKAWYVADGTGVYRFTGATRAEARHKAMLWMERKGFFRIWGTA